MNKKIYNKIKNILKESNEIVETIEPLHNLNEREKVDFHLVLDKLIEDSSPFVDEYILACTWMGHFEQGEYYIPELF